MVQDAGYLAIQHVVRESPKIVWCAHGNAMSDEEFIDLAKETTGLQNTKQIDFMLLLLHGIQNLGKKETPRDSSVVNVDMRNYDERLRGETRLSLMTNLPGAGLWPLKDWKVNLSMLTGEIEHPHEDFWCM
eukprot:3582606-Karenia_brevis.AAC.1